MSDKPPFWETPTALAVILTAAALFGLWLGWLGSRSTPQQITIHFDQPLTVKLIQ